MSNQVACWWCSSSSATVALHMAVSTNEPSDLTSMTGRILSLPSALGRVWGCLKTGMAALIPMSAHNIISLCCLLLQFLLLIEENVFTTCHHCISSCGNPRISPLMSQYKWPRLLLTLVTHRLPARSWKWLTADHQSASFTVGTTTISNHLRTSVSTHRRTLPAQLGWHLACRPSSQVCNML